MGCSSSTAIGTINTQCIALQDIFLKLECDASGTYGCFVRNQGNTGAIAKFINDYCNIFVNGTILTDKQKETFLTQLGNVPAFKIYLPTPTAADSFKHETTILKALTPEERIQHTIYTMPEPMQIFACTIKIKKDNTLNRFRFTEQNEQIETPVDTIHIIFLTICEGDLLIKSIWNINFNQFVTDLVYQIANLHDKNIIHKDIKPENILLCNGTYKLIDFGLAQKWTDTEGIRGFTEYLSTYRYTSPFILDFITGMYEGKLSSGDVTNIRALQKRKVSFTNKLNDGLKEEVDIYSIASTLETSQSKISLYTQKTTWENNDWYALAATIITLYNANKLGLSIRNRIKQGVTYLANFNIIDKTPESILAAFQVPTKSQSSRQ